MATDACVQHSMRKEWASWMAACGRHDGGCLCRWAGLIKGGAHPWGTREQNAGIGGQWCILRAQHALARARRREGYMRGTAHYSRQPKRRVQAATPSAGKGTDVPREWHL